MDLRQSAHGALGPVRAAGSAAEIRPVGIPDRVVVGRGQGGQDRVAFVSTTSRRNVLKAAAGAAAGLAITRVLPPDIAAAQDAERHGISAFGDLKYPADFPHFDYVDPKAPKGGLFSHLGASRQYNQSFLTFNSLNSYILKGDAALGMELTFATLMARAADEPDAMYGLAARSVRI